MLGASAHISEPATKMPIAGQHHGAAAIDVGELAVERRDRRGGQKIGGDDPGQILEIVELAADRGHRGGDDGLIEGSEKHRQHQADDDRADSAWLGIRASRRRRGSGRRPGGTSCSVGGLAARPTDRRGWCVPWPPLAIDSSGAVSDDSLLRSCPQHGGAAPNRQWRARQCCYAASQQTIRLNGRRSGAPLSTRRQEPGRSGATLVWQRFARGRTSCPDGRR